MTSRDRQSELYILTRSQVKPPHHQSLCCRVMCIVPVKAVETVVPEREKYTPIADTGCLEIIEKFRRSPGRMFVRKTETGSLRTTLINASSHLWRLYRGPPFFDCHALHDEACLLFCCFWQAWRSRLPAVSAWELLLPMIFRNS
jgi:hypothetical protein